MAKALLGHVSAGNDWRAVAEIRRLQARVRELENELSDLRDSHVVLHDLRATEALEVSLRLTADEPEPALT